MSNLPDREVVTELVHDVEQLDHETHRLARDRVIDRVVVLLMLAAICVLMWQVFLRNESTDKTAESAQNEAQQGQTQAAQASTTATQASTTATQASTTASRAERRVDRQVQVIRRNTIAYRVIFRWVRGKRGISGQRGAEGPAGANAPPITDAQLAARFDAFCASHGGCVGPAPTEAQILAAAKQVCDQGTCGAASDQQVAEAIADQLQPAVDRALEAYCEARNECRGPEGPAGPQGGAGEQGVGYGCDGQPVPPGGPAPTCPGPTVTETVTVPAPPPAAP